MKITSALNAKVAAPLVKPPAPIVSKTTAPPQAAASEQNNDGHSLSAAEEEALRQALGFSFLVYDPKKHLKSELERLGYENFKYISRPYCGAQALCCTKDGRAYVIFRGSASLLDWAMDFACVPFFWPLCHFGFQTTWLSVRGEVRKWLKATEHDHVLLAGHSLGGAMAHMAAWNLAKDFNIGNVFTFGAPKACFGSSAAKLMATPIQGDTNRKLGEVMYSVVNQRDIVSKVPFRWLGFRDVGHLIYIDYNDNVFVGENALSARESDSMNDINYIAGFLDTENQALMGLEVPEKNLTYYIKQGLFWIGKYLPQIKLAITLPLLYILTCYYFLRSGLNHMTEQYIDVFFGDVTKVDFIRKKPSVLQKLLKNVIRFILITTLSSLFLWGLYEIVIMCIDSVNWQGANSAAIGNVVPSPQSAQ